jgi:hypothetical protein
VAIISNAHSLKLSYHCFQKILDINHQIAQAKAQAHKIAKVAAHAGKSNIAAHAAIIPKAKVAAHDHVKLLNQLSSDKSNNKFQFISWYKS